MQQFTRWKPDTCECVVILTWDSDLATEQVEHSLDKVETRCAAHNTLTEAEILGELFGENQYKNNALNKAVSLMGFTEQDVKDGKVDFTYDASRKLILNIKGATAAKLTAIKAAILVDPLMNQGKNKDRLKSILKV